MGAKIQTSVLAGPRNDTGKDMLSVYHKQNQAKWPGKGQARAVDGAVTSAEKQMESAWAGSFPGETGRKERQMARRVILGGRNAHRARV